MSGQPSLADVAVSTLADIKQIDARLGQTDQERFAIWSLKRAAEQAVLNGLQIAQDIVRAARDVREAVSEVKSEAAEQLQAVVPRD